MTIRVRFAPSPTGLLHPGNARAALINWLFARKEGGEFLLRMDDTDQERSKPEFEEGIKQELTWLGIDWDLYEQQMKRVDRYQAAFEKLKEIGRLYACYETPEELALMRKSQLSQGRPPVYDRAALNLSDADKAKFEAEGRKPHWRFKLEDRVVEWDDLIRGKVHFEGAHSSDPVLFRSDGVPIYTLSSVVDDGELGITHIIRGEDHVTNSAAQVQLFEALGFEVPRFAHMTLFTTATGAGLSKREGSLSLASLREDGIEPMALNSLLAKLGTSDPVEPRMKMQDLIDEFSLSKFARGTPKFDPADLEHLNAKIVHQMTYDEVKARVPETVDEGFWNAVRPNLIYVEDVAHWADICFGDIDSQDVDPEYMTQAVEALPEGSLDQTSWSAWTSALKESTGRKGKELFLPLRLALTGQPHGPEMKDVLPLIPRDTVIKRLTQKT